MVPCPEHPPLCFMYVMPVVAVQKKKSDPSIKFGTHLWQMVMSIFF